MNDALVPGWNYFPYGHFTDADPAEFATIDTNNYDRIAPEFDLIMGYAFHTVAYPIYKKFIDQYLRGTPASGLDLACGTGINLYNLTGDYKIKAYGIDRSQAQIDIADKRLEGKAMLGVYDILEAKYPAGLDFVTMTMDALNHLTEVEHWQLVFNKVRDALKPGGIFMFDINTPGRLLNDWNKPEVIFGPRADYVQIGDEPCGQDGVVWRRTPMIVYKKLSRTLCTRTVVAVIEQMAMPIEMMQNMLGSAGLNLLVEQGTGNSPQGHIFMKNRIFGCAQKPLEAASLR